MTFTSLKLIFTGALSLLLFSCSVSEEKNKKIDRFALVTRHNIILNEFDSLSSLTVGNGRFAFTVDATGLQSFPELYENGVCLGTMSEWGWHSFPNSESYKRKETYKYFEVEQREIPYSIQWKEPERKKNAADYFRENPHRLNLAQLGLELLDSQNVPAGINHVKNINQQLNLWEGVISSYFEIENDKIELETFCHPEKDKIFTRIQSERIKTGFIGIKLRFPYPTGIHVDDASDWTNPEKHNTEIIRKEKNSAVFQHTIDSTVYFAKLNWSGSAEIIERERHYFVLRPGPDNSNFSVSLECKPSNNFEQNEDFESGKESTLSGWKEYWENGGVVDFSGTSDPRANELERRIILSQYLTQVQCAGSFPPQETGLTFNSWYGKFHLEMHWWHAAHWAYWNRIENMEKSLDYYFRIFEKAKNKAGLQGYKGVRWPKMTDIQGNDSPSGVGEFLIWQQPHIIYFAEQCYRNRPDKETLEKYSSLISATADFMADFARWQPESERFILGPPLIPAQESLEKEKTYNPPFELGYWYWGLTTAQKWLTRQNLPPNPGWQSVIDNLSNLPQKNGLYLAAESAPDSYENEEYFSDHPMVLGTFGILPETLPMDTMVMENTFNYIEKNWNWDRTWGWDYPMAAMCATRLGKPEQAIELLLKDVLKNTYLKNGHNYQGKRLRIYLPGNGGLLNAVAMMCAGFEGNTADNPGFPENWTVRWENINPVF